MEALAWYEWAGAGFVIVIALFLAVVGGDWLSPTVDEYDGDDSPAEENELH